MDSEIVKGKPLTKEETKFLLELVEGSKIITTKTTNATNNKLKTEEWIRLTEIFNATATKSRRTWQQLRLKWENLKKNARKRSTKIRMNQIKTGGGPPEYIPPDDILDRVTSLLGSTVGGFTVPFGGDRESTCFVVGGGGGGGDGGGGGGGDGEGGSSGDGFGDARVSLVNENPIISIPMSTDNNIEVDNGIENMVTNYNVLDVVDQNVMTPINTKRFTFSTPRAVKKKLKPDESRIARNNAIAEYFNTKKQCLDAKTNNIHLENDNLQLKNLQLSLENEKLVVETEKLKLELQNLKESL